MKYFICAGLICITISWCADAEKLPIPYTNIEAPVVHSSHYHVLTCGKICVVLDGIKGMSLCMTTYTDKPDGHLDSSNAVLTNAHLRAAIIVQGKKLEVDQVYDPAAHLEIIDQGPGRVAARTYFNLCSPEGIPYGSGTLDIYVYAECVHLAQSMYIDYQNGGVVITEAGFSKSIPGKNGEILMGGSMLVPTEDTRFLPFGDNESGFNITVDNPGYASMRIGWLRNLNPEWLYLNEIDSNPETDELYEKWPLWITQRGNSLTWKRTDNSGLIVRYENKGLSGLEFRWINGDSLDVPGGGYTALNGFMALFFGPNSAVADELWGNHEKPSKPKVTSGVFKYYNEIEGVYEIDSQGGNVDITFENMNTTHPNPVYVRIWNLAGKGGYEVAVDGKAVPFGLYNDGDIIEDPMVPFVKDATGPARFASVAFSINKGTNGHLTITGKPGIQMTYQMYSDLETYEAWMDACTEEPLFRFHLCECSIYHATLPGRNEYAFAKLPLFWLKNGVNNDTFMNHVRGFRVLENGPNRLRFTLRSVDLLGAGLSSYTLDIPCEQNRITCKVRAEFTPLDNGRRWTSVEYCDLYPFDNVYRRTFHYDDVVFLNHRGIFDRVGTGAWSERFVTVMEPERLGYYSNTEIREGSGSRTPDSADGTVWILGNNTERGNILYCRGDWTPSEGAESVFSLCNAWVDIHNTITNRQNPSAGESIRYTVEVFGGQVPSLDRLNEMYQKAAGVQKVKQVTMVKYSESGEILGFEVK